MTNTQLSGSSSSSQSELEDKNSILARLKEVAGVKTDSDLGRYLGVAPQTVNQVTRKPLKAIPDIWILKLSLQSGVNEEWLRKGTGPKFREGEHQPGHSQGGDGNPLYKDTPGMPALRMVPKRKARLCAGTGSLTTDETVTGYYAFRHEFLARKGNPAAMALVDVYGDSMSPDICDGDTVLVDESQKEIMPGRIYAVGLDEEVVVKMVDKQPGKLVLLSKNEHYQPLIIDMAEVDGTVRIVGRVLWWCREAR